MNMHTSGNCTWFPLVNLFFCFLFTGMIANVSAATGNA